MDSCIHRKDVDGAMTLQSLTVYVAVALSVGWLVKKVFQSANSKAHCGGCSRKKCEETESNRFSNQ